MLHLPWPKQRPLGVLFGDGRPGANYKNKGDDMDEEFIQKVKTALNARITSPTPGVYNIVLPVTERAAERIVDLLAELAQEKETRAQSGKPAL